MPFVCFVLSSLYTMYGERKSNILLYGHPINQFKVLKNNTNTWSISLNFSARKSCDIFFVEKNHFGRWPELSEQKFHQRCLSCSTLPHQKTKLSLLQFHRKIVKNRSCRVWIGPSKMLHINERMGHEREIEGSERNRRKSKEVVGAHIMRPYMNNWFCRSGDHGSPLCAFCQWESGGNQYYLTLIKVYLSKNKTQNIAFLESIEGWQLGCIRCCF